MARAFPCRGTECSAAASHAVSSHGVPHAVSPKRLNKLFLDLNPA